MFRLSLGDVWRGLLMAVLTPVVIGVTAALGSVISVPGFDVLAVDWLGVGHNLLNITIVSGYGAGVAYIVKNFFTSTQGNVLSIGDK